MIGKVFATARVPDEWLPSYIVLIPKINEAEKPKYYRPITVGNITYRLLMKLVAQRLQPHMKNLISTEQTAFLKGRNITDNTILAREIIHSFNSSSYNEEAFMLKADVNKAFDTVQWHFIYAAMQAVNFPKNLVQLVNRGLRQGCPLSPYLFILVTEFLTRSLKMEALQGSIKVIKLARSAPVITHSMYADDLVLMGQANLNEVNAFKSVLEEFAENTGLSINPDKSTLWFSQRCAEECKQEILGALQAKPAGDSEKYLGVFISQSSSQQDQTHEVLVNRFHGRMVGWKMHLLSYAGRLALIKSMLISLPVYFMSIAQLLTATIKAINKLMRDFLWGKLGGERYMVPIAWHKVCCASDEGGLGIRDVELFNKSLLLKVVWQLTQNQDRIWVKVMRAKYYPRGGLWNVKGIAGSSKLWKTIQNLKPFFRDQIVWEIADGKKIPALNQPWYPGWNTITVRTNQQRDVTVARLFDSNIGQWDNQIIMEIMGERHCKALYRSLQNLLPILYSLTDSFGCLARQEHTRQNRDTRS